jgi:beta-glucosidase
MLEGTGHGWLGANFWSSSGGPRMWTRYDRDLVRRELAVLRDHGLGVTRSFFYWPDVMPEPHRLDEDVLRRFADFLDAHTEVGMRTIPTFIVGHMSGENWDPPWRAGRDLYADTWLVARQAWYIQSVVGRFATHPAITGWLISNEMPIYGMSAPREVVSSWAQLMVQAVRAGGGTQPVSLGDGAWGVEVTGDDNGFSVRDLSDDVDFVGPHVYRMETDVVRQHLKSAFVCELAAVGGKPVVLEEFGLSSEFASDDNAGHYYRQQLNMSLLGGATGWIAWNNADYDNLIGQDPYRHHPFEMHFGITTNDGTPKRPLLELADFGKTLAAVEPERCQRLPAHVAVVLSAYAEADIPFTHTEDRRFVFAAVEQAHVAAREADLALGFAREADGIAGGYQLYLVPSTKQLLAPSWVRLGELAAAGSVVYVSYCAGVSDVQRGPWWTATEQLFGVRHELVYGLNDPITDDVVTLRFDVAFGGVAAGETLQFRAAGNENSRAFLPVNPTDGEVVARDGAGRPAILRKRHGTGAMVLCTYPLEAMAAAQGRVNPEPTWRLYDALAREAGVEPVVRVRDPRVVVDGLVRDDGRVFVWLVSESADALAVEPVVASGGRLRPVKAGPDSGEPTAKVDLGPYAVRVFELDEGNRR